MHPLRARPDRLPATLAAFVIMVGCGLRGSAQPATLEQEGYLLPPKAIADVILAARENVALTNLSPDGKKFLLVKNDGLAKLDRLARPCVHLGELAFDPIAHRAHFLYVRSNVGYELFDHAERKKVAVQVPPQARVSNPAWSPDGSQLAFYAHFLDATHLYVADTGTGQSRPVTKTRVLATLANTFQWSADGKRLQTVLVADGAAAAKLNGGTSELKVRVALEGKFPSRTFRYLLESPQDVQLFEQLITGQLALIDVADGKVTKVGPPSPIRNVSMSPGGTQFRVATVKKPFSYYVPADRFGALESIWDQAGKPLYTLADRKLRDTEPPPPVTALAPAGKGFGKKAAVAPPVDPDTLPKEPADPGGKRDLGWRPDGAGLSFIQTEPVKAGDDKKPARGDRVLHWLPPFAKDSAKVVYEAPQRILSVQYSADCRWLFVTQLNDNQRQIVAVDVQQPKKTYPLHQGGKAGGANPAAELESPFTPESAFPERGDDEQPPAKKGALAAGGFGPSLLTRTGRGDTEVVRVSSKGEVYLAGTDRPGGGALPRPYLDRIEIKTGAKQRLFAGKSDLLETIDAVDGDDVTTVFTTRQKKDVVPDSYRIDLAGGKEDKLTSNVDPAPWYHQLQVQRFQVTRVDGFKFWVKVTTPPKASGKLPALFWIYPRDYVDQAAYNRVTAKDGQNTGRFAAPAVRSMTLLTLLGYAVVEPDVPIVGPAGRSNDNYVPDLRNSLWAVIDALDRRGLIDRDRLAIGGHSYGGFSTANALVHTPFFKAGIAGDGNYNRTLTPMTFQTEKRQLWEARETYLEMSPVLWADRINGALLMYHSLEDANVGTHPSHAEHLFRVLRGLGKPAALYLYPYEGHGPLALETTLDQWARWTAWLDRYVKEPQQR